MTPGASAAIGLFALVTACRHGYDPGAVVDDAGGPDAAVPDAAEVPPDATACDPAAPLVDSFAGPLADPRWIVYGDNGAAAAIVNGRLRVTVPEATPRRAYAGYISRGPYSVLGGRLSVDVPTMVDTVGHAQALMQLIEQDGTVAYRAGFEQQNGVLHYFTRSATGREDHSTAYSPVEHRHWQLREEAGQIHFETSPDGVAWTVQLTAATPFDATRVHIELSGGVYQSEVAPGFAEFDDLAGTVPAGTSCKRNQAARRR